MTSDVEELQQLVLHERQGRDRGRWDQMAAAFAPGARVRISWLDGTAEQFVAGSRLMAASGTTAAHRMGAVIVDLVGQRALIEAPAVIELRTLLGGVEVDLSSRVRLVYRAERKRSGWPDGAWLLESLDCIYESDSVSPVVPGEIPDVDAAALARLRPAYRWLAYVLDSAKHFVDQGMPGEDEPEAVAALYDAARVWLHEERVGV